MTTSGPRLPFAHPALSRSGIDPVQGWRRLHDRLHDLIRSHATPDDFLQRLAAIDDDGGALLASQVDASLFTLVQMLFQSKPSYSVVHALLAAAICRIVAPLAGLSTSEQGALVRAALTMNLAMSELHDELRRQSDPLSAAQRSLILGHPDAAVRRLVALGVNDAGWLRYVRDHHETVSGTGYPRGKRDLCIGTRVLQMADVFIGRISPRNYRQGIPPQEALRNLYLGADNRPDPLAAIFVKMLGIYVPGSYVKLTTRELAIVARRGDQAHTPIALAIVGSRGSPLPTPLLRDTALPEHEIACSIAPEQVRVHLDLTRLIHLAQ